jgi:AcrR family transcriptional regulator
VTDARSSIVEAAARLLHDAGAAAVTTRGVAQAAGVQAPTIYRLFGDKDGLVDAVAEHVMAAYVAEKAAAATDPDPVADLCAGWHTQIDFGLANPDLYALLNAPGRRPDSPATAAGTEVLRARVHRLAAAGLLRVDEDRAIAMIRAAGTGTVLVLLDQPADRRDLGVSDAMLETVLRGILTDAPAAPDTGVTAVAVTFAATLPDLPGLTDAERTLMAEWLARSLARLRSG